MASDLTANQEAFCQAYLIDLNGTNAAIAAGYSEKSARSQASKLLAMPEIQDRIDFLNRERQARVQITSDMILLELLKIARTDIGQAFDVNGNMKPINEIPEDVRRAIQAIEVDELFEGQGHERTQVGLTKKIKFWDKVKSLELLGKHLKLFTERHEVQHNLTLEQLVAASQQKIEGE